MQQQLLSVVASLPPATHAEDGDVREDLLDIAAGLTAKVTLDFSSELSVPKCVASVAAGRAAHGAQQPAWQESRR
jgi:hypothetical protein